MTDFPHGLMFHHFWNDLHPRGQGAISGDDLSQMIDTIGRDRFLSPAQWVERAVAGRLRPGDLCITFDDSLRSQYDIAVPVLDSMGLTAFFFVYSSVFDGILERLEIYRYLRTTCFDDIADFYAAFENLLMDGSQDTSGIRAALADFHPGRYLADFPFYTDADRRFRFLRDDVLGPTAYGAVMERMVAEHLPDMAALRDLLWMDDDCLLRLHRHGHMIGLHSYSHPTRLNALDFAGQFGEYRRNQDHLHRVLGTRPHTMSHPCNSYNADTISVLNDLGVTLGFRSNDVIRDGGRFEYPRRDHAVVIRDLFG
jgi:peptidoglycan/xylan/chitin deacetylase (PgdA/CDA1 family)